MSNHFQTISGEKISKKAKKANAFQKLSTKSLLVYSILVYIFMFFPLLVMILMSFNDSKVQGLPIVGLTMQWYEDLFSDLELWVALLRSFIVSIGSVLISIVIGLCSAFLLNRYNFPGKKFYRTVIMLPLIIPGVILGISLLSTFNMLGMKTSLFTVMIGHSTFILPLIVFVLNY